MRTYNGLLFYEVAKMPTAARVETMGPPSENRNGLSPILGQAATRFLSRIADNDKRLAARRLEQIEERGRALTEDEERWARFGHGTASLSSVDSTAFTRWLAEQTRGSDEAALRGPNPMRLFLSRHQVSEGRVAIDYQRMGNTYLEETLAHLVLGADGVALESMTGHTVDITDVPGVAEALWEDAEKFPI